MHVKSADGVLEMTYSTLPQLNGGLFLSDGGMETTLIYLDGLDLPQFAAFTLLLDPAGRRRLANYYRPYLELAAATPSAGFILETPTWRASADWGALLGYDEPALAQVNRDAASLATELRDEWRFRVEGAIVVSGQIGPRGDGYVTAAPSSAEESAAYHRPQALALRDGGVDMLSAMTMTSATEAIGVARAATAAGLPFSISFTVETDGRLPSGESLQAAIEAVDADTPPAYFGLNCAHPSHFEQQLAQGGAWARRIRCIRANASPRSHAELDASTELDIGDPDDLGNRYRNLRTCSPALNVLGGCCGTDFRHLKAIRDAWVAATC